VRSGVEKRAVSVVHEYTSVRQAARKLLQSSGFNVDTFASVEGFLESGRVDRTACLVVDVEMPFEDGLLLQGYFACTGRRFPVIFVTASPYQNVRERAVQAGATDLMHAANGAQALLDCIGSILSMKETL
jgi:FixJ family two-component response regulator